VVLASYKVGATDGHEYSNVYDSISNVNGSFDRESKKVINPAIWRGGWVTFELKMIYSNYLQFNRHWTDNRS
jgi:hypothetical protein